MHRLFRGEQGTNALRRVPGARHASREWPDREQLQANGRHTLQEVGLQMVGARRECTDGNEELLEELAVERVRPMEGPTDRRRLTNKFGVHPGGTWLLKPLAKWHMFASAAARVFFVSAARLGGNQMRRGGRAAPFVFGSAVTSAWRGRAQACAAPERIPRIPVLKPCVQGMVSSSPVIGLNPTWVPKVPQVLTGTFLLAL